MAGNVILRSYLDLDNGALENTVNYSNDRNPLSQQYSSLRRFTKVVGGLLENTVDGTSLTKSFDPGHPENGIVFTLTMDEDGKNVEEGLRNRLISNANGVYTPETKKNSLVYNKSHEWVQYILEFGPDLKNPRYLAFFNIDDAPIYVCKCAKIDNVEENWKYSLVPFLTVLPGQSVGPMIFNPRYGNLFVVSDTDSTPQDLYVIAYNA